MLHKYEHLGILDYYFIILSSLTCYSQPIPSLFLATAANSALTSEFKPELKKPIQFSEY